MFVVPSSLLLAVLKIMSQVDSTCVLYGALTFEVSRSGFPIIPSQLASGKFYCVLVESQDFFLGIFIANLSPLLHLSSAGADDDVFNKTTLGVP